MLVAFKTRTGQLKFWIDQLLFCWKKTCFEKVVRYPGKLKAEQAFAGSPVWIFFFRLWFCALGSANLISIINQSAQQSGQGLTKSVNVHLLAHRLIHMVETFRPTYVFPERRTSNKKTARKRPENGQVISQKPDWGFRAQLVLNANKCFGWILFFLTCKCWNRIK